MSRSSISDTPMTGTERQARYLAARADGALVVRVRRPADRRRSNRHGVSPVIDQPDSPTGKTGKGHEDAWWGNRPQLITV